MLYIYTCLVRSSHFQHNYRNLQGLRQNICETPMKEKCLIRSISSIPTAPHAWPKTSAAHEIFTFLLDILFQIIFAL
jgi:hypothetical protein